MVLLTPLLRLAVALDQSQEQRVERVEAVVQENSVELRLFSDRDVDIEQWQAEQVAAVFREAYGLAAGGAGQAMRTAACTVADGGAAEEAGSRSCATSRASPRMPDAIHDLRVSIRRLKQELHVFEAWFDAGAREENPAGVCES